MENRHAFFRNGEHISPRAERSPSAETTFDYVLGECKNKSPQDTDGIQPLHIAAASRSIILERTRPTVPGCRARAATWRTVMPSFVTANISGADMFAVTKEGMTVLHVAARARQPGTVGLVLSQKSRRSEVPCLLPHFSD
jgi:ankyrin repeat protein